MGKCYSFAEQGNTELADLFEKTAKAERLEHFAEEAKRAGLIGNDQANLQRPNRGRVSRPH